MSEPLRDKQCWYLDGVPIHHSADVKSAVEYRLRCNTIIFPEGEVGDCAVEGCPHGSFIQYKPPNSSGETYCFLHIAVHCYPDLFVEKGVGDTVVLADQCDADVKERVSRESTTSSNTSMPSGIDYGVCSKDKRGSPLSASSPSNTSKLPTLQECYDDQ